jgi:hypothetical protein
MNALWTISNREQKVVPMLWRPMLGEIVKDLSRVPLCRFLALLVLRGRACTHSNSKLVATSTVQSNLRHE